MRVLGYKVRNSATGEYLRSGGYWSKTGKTWGRRGDLTLALRYNWKSIKDDLETIEIIELVEGETIPFKQFYDRPIV